MKRLSAEVLILVVLAAAFLAAVITRERARVSAERHIGPTAFSYRPEGTRAFFELCQRRGVDAVLWTKDVAGLRSDTAIVFLMEPIRQEITARDADRLQEWVRSGGTLVLVMDAVAGVSEYHRPHGVELGPRDDTPRSLAVTSSDPLLRDVSVLRVSRGPRLLLNDGLFRAIVTDRRGVLVAERRMGKGSWIVVSAALAPTNRNIGLADNAVFFMNIAERAGRNRSVVFYERAHMKELAAEDKGRWWKLLPGGVKAAAWLAALIVIAAVWNGNTRFGKVGSTATAVRPEAVETAGSLYISSMGKLLQRARCPALAAEYIHVSLEHDLARRGFRRDGPAGSSVVPAGREGLAGQIEAVLAEGRSAASSGQWSDDRLLKYARRVYALRKELGLD